MKNECNEWRVSKIVLLTFDHELHFILSCYSVSVWLWLCCSLVSVPSVHLSLPASHSCPFPSTILPFPPLLSIIRPFADLSNVRGPSCSFTWNTTCPCSWSSFHNPSGLFSRKIHKLRNSCRIWPKWMSYSPLVDRACLYVHFRKVFEIIEDGIFWITNFSKLEQMFLYPWRITFKLSRWVCINLILDSKWLVYVSFEW